MGLPASKFLFYFSHYLRHHPFRFLIRGKLFGFFTPTEPVEEELCRRSWPGPVWDVGASLGKYTPMMAEANPDKQVYAFEPNLNSLYYLGYRTAKYPNVNIVPAPLMADTRSVRVSYDPNFHKPPSGPQGIAFSVPEAIRWFGVPAFIKLDCEGQEKKILEQCGEELSHTTLLVEWHPWEWNYEFPPMPYWKVTKVTGSHSLLEPLK